MNNNTSALSQTQFPEQETAAGFVSLLGDLEQAPRAYRVEVAETKRALERWVCDARLREDYAKDPAAALRRFDLKLTPAQLHPLIDRETALALNDAIARGDTDAFPSSVLRYRAFIREKIRHRQNHRLENEPHHPRLAKWWWRQMYRLAGEVGVVKADRIVHAPLSIELTRGCSVHCWFCALRASKLEEIWPYSDANARLWREVLDVLGGVIGPTAARHGFLYWATEPLDHPDYERFLVDFHDAYGGCPQTTTAKPTADVERTRRLLRLSLSLGGHIDRFSILSLSMLDQVHRSFTAEELLRVELLPQNREADDHHKKANIGRAQDHETKRAGELSTGSSASTTACVSGFLLNMVDRRVQLITPCAASDDWPLGFRILQEATFDSAPQLADVIDSMIDRQMPATLELRDPVRLRPNQRIKLAENGDLHLVSQLSFPISGQPQPQRLMALLTDGAQTVAELVETRLEEAGVEPERTLLLLHELFEKGILLEPPRHDP
ncbi:radical SAM family RiPP maturation amino acid epimerase [Rhabdochromatium marinum]|uniref:radical SAM family RiPP maturation amino acid epimerase n=1 Tax=Rhabdochromatium marinum TaxID=48729 RepID=UPI0019083573|nr:radical SAM family RiPP maturation amino acid epimerase [Rhabdochromatium marinum]